MKKNIFVHIILLMIIITPSVVMSKSHGIVFVSEQYGHPEIFSMSLDGTNRKRLTNTAKHMLNSQPSVSPSGKKIVFVSSNLSARNLYIMNHDGTELKQLTFYTYPIEAYYPVWSPDGTNIAFIKIIKKQDSFGKLYSGEVFLISPDGRIEKQLTKIWEVSPNRIDWHKKENKLMFVTQKWGGINTVVKIDPRNQNDGLVVPTGGSRLGYFSFAPEVTTKVLCAGFINNRQHNIYSLETVVINEKERTRVSRLTNEKSPSTKSRQPSFSPDGKLIIFTSNRSGMDKVYVMDADGKNERIISVVKENEYDPRWFPRPDKETQRE